jgi:preflagellin peptidase FlaK
MEIVELIYGVLILVLCVITTTSDLKYGLIKNKVLLIFAILAGILDIIYYGCLATDLRGIFCVNAIVNVLIGLILFFLKSFAGGDCKLLIVLTLLYPANYYLVYGDSKLTLLLTIGLAIIYGYMYLLITSIWGLVRRKNSISFADIKTYVLVFFKAYIIALLYVNAALLVIKWVSIKYIQLNSFISQIICMVVAITVGKIGVLKKWFMVVTVVVIDIFFSLLMGVMPVSLNPENYILVLILLVAQIVIRTNLYEEIDITALRKGMILSFGSSAMMQNSRVKGIPGISSENLGNRLSESEVESVKRWGKSRSVTTIVIVKKIPFAVFLNLGFISYFIVWSFLVWG